MGGGDLLPFPSYANYLDMNAKAAIEWMENNGKGLWELTTTTRGFRSSGSIGGK